MTLRFCAAVLPAPGSRVRTGTVAAELPHTGTRRGKTGVNQAMSFRWGALMDEKRIARSNYGGDPRLGALITQRITPEDINPRFDDLKAGRALRSVIMFGDAT